MAEQTQIIERTEAGTVIRTGANGQRTVLPHVLPILPIRNIVVFPGTVMPLNVGRAKSKSLLDEVMPGDKLIGVCTQKNPDVEDPGYPDLHTVGVACVILKLFKLPDGNQSIIVHGLTRFRLLSIDQNDPFTTGRIEVLEDHLTAGPSLDALLASVRQQANRVIELSPNTPDEAAQVLNSITAPSALADFLAANLQAETADKQLMLEELDVEKRLRMIAARLATQLDVLELQNKIQSQVKENIDKSQRRYYLQEQLKAIRKELGEAEGGAAGGEVEQLRQKLEAAKLPEHVMKEADRELARLESIPSASPEYGVIRTWLQIVSELPWALTTSDKIELVAARGTRARHPPDTHTLTPRNTASRAVLNPTPRTPAAPPAPAPATRAAGWAPGAANASATSAVRATGSPGPGGAVVSDPGAPAPGDDSDKRSIPGNVGEENVGGAGAILCFVGPPGVGKTSLGKSIAEAMGRRFIRVALGGVRDEADIRGHRRTYIGSMPGRVIAELRKAGTRNPVMMLDEIDKLGADFRGDPASALLEVLDPRRTTRSPTTTSTSCSTSPRSCSSPRATRWTRSPARSATAWRSSRSPATPRPTSSTSPSRYLVPRQLEANGLTDKNAKFADAAAVDDRGVHPRGGACATSSGASAGRPRGGGRGRRRQRAEGRRRPRLRLQGPRPPPVRAGTRQPHRRPRRRDRHGLHAVRRRDPLHRGRALPGQGRDRPDRPDRRRDEGVGHRRVQPRAVADEGTGDRPQAPGRERHPHPRPGRAPCRRTALLPAPRCSPHWRRC